MKRAISTEMVWSLFKNLTEGRILTKAYFILGGPWESKESATATIDFAVSSGATLAYFALYKDFAGAARTLSRPHARSTFSGEAYLSYKQLVMSWDAAFARGLSSLDSGDLGRPLAYPPSDIEQACYTQLSARGFRFFDVVKYNDFHSDEGPSESLLNAATWSCPAEYFSLIEQAYRRFYLRPEFVRSYEALLASGY